MKKTTLASVLSIAMLFSATNVFAGSWWPKLPDIGISIPPISEWKVGGTLGATWEGNKEALRLGAVGLAVLGPIGLIYGVSQGAKLDIQKRHALKLYNRMMEQQNMFADASNRYQTASEAAANDYNDTSKALGDFNAPDEAYSRLEDNSIAFLWCLVGAQDKIQANKCLRTLKIANMTLIQDYEQ